MNIYKDNELMLASSIVTIGAFDGLHRGHQSLLRQTVKRARQNGVPSVVYTFNPPPRALFQQKRIIMSVEEKIDLLKDYDIDHVVIADFNTMYASKRPMAFINELGAFHPQEIIVGPNFTFGKNKEGNINLLARHFTIHVQPFVKCEQNEVISSTRIRELIESNETKQAEKLLGRKYLEVINI